MPDRRQGKHCTFIIRPRSDIAAHLTCYRDYKYYTTVTMLDINTRTMKPIICLVSHAISAQYLNVVQLSIPNIDIERIGRRFQSIDVMLCYDRVIENCHMSQKSCPSTPCFEDSCILGFPTVNFLSFAYSKRGLLYAYIGPLDALSEKI